MAANLFNLPWLSESIKKCTIKYLIERYLGHFLYEELDLSQLDVELFNGTASIESIPLNVNTINQEVSPYFPLKFLEGFVNKIEFAVPWSALWTDSCSIQLDGIRLNFCKLQKCTEHERNQTSILSKSMMVSSMEMAEEILQQEPEKYEGLEKFAQLINSIVRRVKISAKNTVIKFVFPQKSGPNQEIELRIGHIKCEEEEINLDQNKDNNVASNQKSDNTNNKNSDMLLSDVVTKKITLEGIEILINDVSITKLHKKHTLKLRFYGDRIDMEAYFGSYIFAILNSDHLKILELFFQMMDENDGGGSLNHDDDDKNSGNQTKKRLMTNQDYRRIQEMLRYESTNRNSTGISKHSNDLMSSSRVSNHGGGKSWTTDTSLQEDEFKPFDQDTAKDKKENQISDGQKDTMFTCNIRIPGVILCLISGDDGADDHGETGDEIGQTRRFDMPLIDDLSSLIGLNEYLNETLADFNHVRVFASNICLKIECDDQMQFSGTNVSSYEFHHGDLQPLFWVNDGQSDSSPLIRPSILLKKHKNVFNLNLAPTSIRLDPTIIERHHRLFEFFQSSSSSSSQQQQQQSHLGRTKANNGQEDFELNIECEMIDLELFFPVPDLRPERDRYSSLHDEVLLLQMQDIGFRIDSNSGELLCKEINIDLRQEDSSSLEPKRIFHSFSEQKNIKLYFSTLIPFNITDEQFDENILITEMNSMHESVNFLHSSAIQHDRNNEPFQVKRNMFGEESHERIITPGDRDHIRHYIAHNRELTKFYMFIHVPYAEVFFEDKTMFELVYNRFCNDLILWRPFFGRRKPSSKLPELILPMLNEPLTGSVYDHHGGGGTDDVQNTIFLSCKNNNDYAESLDDSIISDNSYHSVLDSSDITLQPQNEFVVEIDFDNLNIDLHCKSGKKNNLFVQNFLTGIIGGPADMDPSTVVCICSENLTLQCDSKPMVVNNSHLDLNSELNAAIEIRRESENFKKIKLAAQLRNATLLGLDLAFFEDLWEFVNVKDDEIQGYVCPRVTIELHIDVMKSGILFDNLKERATLIHLEDLYLTSMVVENTNQTILRFFIEEALLCFKRNNHCDDENMKNFISVIDSGIIDINLKISKDGQIEWKGSNNEINLKVCHDSLAALCQFIQSFSTSETNDSDRTNLNRDENLAEAAPAHPSSANEIHLKKNETDRNELIADALSECVLGGTTVQHNNGDGSDGDDDEDEDNDEDDDNDDDLRKSGGKANKDNQNCFNDNSPMDESNFLILGENDLGSGINLGQEPRIRVLVDEPIMIVENHFKITHYNVIPDITPATVCRYLLDRMSLNVYLYAGKDFDDVPEDETPPANNINGERRRSTNSNNKATTDAISQVNVSLKKEKTNKSSSSIPTGTTQSLGGRSEPKVRFQPSTSSVLWENIDLISTKSYCNNMNNAQDNHFSFKSTGGLKRKSDTHVVLVLKRIKILFDQFAKDDPMAWILLFMVEELEIIDKVSVSKINKMLYEYYSESMPRRRYSSMFSVRLNCHRNQQDMLEEGDLTVSLKPLRVNIDQDTLFFLMEFFSKFSETLSAKLPDTTTSVRSSSSSSSSMQDIHNESIKPSMKTDNNEDQLKRFDSRSSINSAALSDDHLSNDNDEDILYSSSPINEQQSSMKQPPARSRRESAATSGSHNATTLAANNPNIEPSSSNAIYIKSFTFWPDVPIRLDYHGKHIDLKQGALPGIALGLAQLNQSELCLKKLVNKHGLLGLDKVIQFAVEEWGKDIKRNQLPSILGGVGPMHSFIQLFQGIRDLFWIPIDQYRRDQRIVRGLQRGAYAFSVSTAMATLEIANRLVSFIQSTAQFAHDVVTPPNFGGGVGGGSAGHRNQLVLNSQPRDLREGFTAACAVIREGFHDTVRGMTNTNLVADDTVTVIGQVVRQIPSTVVRPFIHFSEATSNVLIGIRNQLTPEARKDDQEKWKNANDW